MNMVKSLGIGDSLLVMLIGMLIVFLGLVILIFLIKGLVALTGNLGKQKSKPQVTLQAVPVPKPENTAAEENLTPDDDCQVVAAIMAALSILMENQGGFTVRRIRRVNNQPAWQRAGREEQMYSRF